MTVLRSDDLEHVTSCELCGGAAFSPWRVCREPDAPSIIRPMRGDREFSILRCDDCGLGFVSPRYDKHKLADLYGPDYYHGSDRASTQARKRFWAKESRIAGHAHEARLLRAHLAGGVVLDAGCGPGFFADALGKGYRVTGADNSEAALAIARNASACEATLSCDVERESPGEAAFDAAVMIQTLDHLRHPLAALTHMARALKPGGMLMIARLPNLAAPLARLYGNDFRLLAPNHLFCFTPRTIRAMLAAAGFACMAVHYPFFSTPFFRPGWCATAPVAVLRRLMGLASTPPPGPGNVMSVIAVKPSGSGQ